MKSKQEILKSQSEKIIAGAEKNEKQKVKTSTVSLEEDVKKEFQSMMGKGTGLNMSLVFNAFMKMYVKNPEMRKKVSQEIINSNTE